jgi:hypothetical protein
VDELKMDWRCWTRRPASAAAPSKPKLQGRDATRPHTADAQKQAMKSKRNDRGKLKIGDDWNAIRIIALSQSNPLRIPAKLTGHSAGT